MTGSQNTNIDFILALYRDSRTVFRFIDIAMLTKSEDFRNLNNRINYYVRSGKILNPRKGIYAKPGFSHSEFACCLYTPCYISLEFVLQRAGVVFQFNSGISLVSYLSREIENQNQRYHYRKIRHGILLNTAGIIRQKENINIATPERAFLDLLYLEKDFYADNLAPLNKEQILKLLPLYHSVRMNKQVKLLLHD